jgi:metal transporter CNNM
MVDYLVILICIVLVALSGLFSGLTLGLLGLNKTELERKIKLGDKKAKKVYEVRKKGNLLLCTLLMGNVAVNSALALFLGSLATGVVAGAMATGLIVIFGEIIPQASISRYALDVGARTVWLVKFFIFILYPICWPLSKMLDVVLGDEMPTVWSKNELEEIIKLHEDSSHSSLDADEEKIILGALSFSSKTAKDVLTPRINVFTLEKDEVIDAEMLSKIKKAGFSRIPIYNKEIDKIYGLLYAKELIDLNKKVKAGKICTRRKLIRISDTKKLDVLLNQLIRERIHLALVFDKYNEFLGIVTMEDIIERIFKREIVDEYDKVKKGKKKKKKK